MCVSGVFLAFVAVLISLLFILFVTAHHRTNFLLNLYTGTVNILILISVGTQRPRKTSHGLLGKGRGGAGGGDEGVGAGGRAG